MSYRVMEYLDGGRACPIGYAFLEDADYAAWRKDGKRGEVKAYAVVGGMEDSAEWGMVERDRLWDYGRTVKSLPPAGRNVEEWLKGPPRPANA